MPRSQMLLRLLALVTLVAACPAQERRVELPRVGTVGDEPPAARTCVVEIRRDGTIRVVGKTLACGELRKHLLAEARKFPGRVAMIGARRLTFSKLNLLIRADRGLPSAAIYQVLRLGLEGDTVVSRIFYGVRHEKTGEPGAMAMFLPGDVSDGTFTIRK